jgi:hypothetical protein
MTWLMENPAAIIAIGVVIEIALAVALLTTGRGLVLGLMLLAAVTTCGMLVLERYVITDREAVRVTLDQAAHSLTTNNADRVLNFVDPQATDLRQHVKTVLQQFDFQDASIGGDVDMQINAAANPPTATATFFAHIRARGRHGNTIGREQAIERLRVDLHRVDGRWLVTDAHVAERRLP